MLLLMAKSHICVTDLLKSEQKESCIKVWKVMLRLWWNQTDGKQDIKSHKVSRQRKETEFQKIFFKIAHQTSFITMSLLSQSIIYMQFQQVYMNNKRRQVTGKKNNILIIFFTFFSLQFCVCCLATYLNNALTRSQVNLFLSHSLFALS